MSDLRHFLCLPDGAPALARRLGLRRASTCEAHATCAHLPRGQRPHIDRYVPDQIFADPRLAAIYDDFNRDRSDLDHYEAIVDELGAHRAGHRMRHRCARLQACAPRHHDDRRCALV